MSYMAEVSYVFHPKLEIIRLVKALNQKTLSELISSEAWVVPQIPLRKHEMRHWVQKSYENALHMRKLIFLANLIHHYYQDYDDVKSLIHQIFGEPPLFNLDNFDVAWQIERLHNIRIINPAQDKSIDFERLETTGYPEVDIWLNDYILALREKEQNKIKKARKPINDGDYQILSLATSIGYIFRPKSDFMNLVSESYSSYVSNSVCRPEILFFDRNSYTLNEQKIETHIKTYQIKLVFFSRWIRRKIHRIGEHQSFIHEFFGEPPRFSLDKLDQYWDVEQVPRCRHLVDFAAMDLKAVDFERLEQTGHSEVDAWLDRVISSMKEQENKEG